MQKVDFCPFINGQCKNDCVFNCGHYIALGNGKQSKCEIASLLSSDIESVIAVADEIRKLKE